jgi:branched-chain amino acid transport system ATP-binding protein
MSSEVDRALPEEALEVRDLSVSYGDFVAVHHCSFKVNAGDRLAVIGPNGNGKSSIAMAIAGLVKHRGVIKVFGAKAPPLNPVWMCRRGVVLVPERRQLFARMTVADNVLLGCYAWTRRLKEAKKSAAYERSYELFPELADRRGQLAGTLSGGQQQMVAIARGIASSPRVLIIDEPCLGLAEGVSARVYLALEELSNSQMTIILIEENPIRALELCTQTIRVERGIGVATKLSETDSIAVTEMSGQ